MHNLVNYYDYDFSVINREDDEDFYHKYKDHEPKIRHFKD